MVYLVIKELADTAEDVIMVTSSVMKDVAGAGGRGSGEQDIYRANAIRALCRIIDVSVPRKISYKNMQICDLTGSIFMACVGWLRLIYTSGYNRASH